MNSFSLTLPTLKRARRAFSSHNKFIIYLLIGGALLVSFSIYYGLYRFLEHVARAPMLGETFGPIVGGLLVAKLLEMLLLTLLFMVLFSSIIAALSAFYLSEELPVLMSSPQPVTRIFRSRFIIMSFESSWMVVAFFMPALLAFATALNASATAYFIFPLFLVMFILLPNMIGALTALTLSSFFPIRQMKKMFQFLSMLVLTGLVFFLRSLEAEKLLNPSYFQDISQYLLSLQVPLINYSPSFWMHSATISLFRNNDIAGAFMQITPMIMLIVAGLYILTTLSARFYRDSWQKSMEAVDNQVLSLERLRSVIIWPLRFTSNAFRVIATKEVTNFLRDPAIFSQIFMMGAIIFVYGYNLSILPLKDLPTLYSGEINDSLVFLNGPFIGFILASIGMRFVYPSISMEGRAFWAVKSSPVKVGRILFIKYFIYLVPMLILGNVLCAVTNSIFSVSHPILFYLSFINVTIIACVVTALAIGAGAIYAEFDADSPLRIAGSYGGFIYMVLSGLFVLNLLLFEAYPMFRFFFQRTYSIKTYSPNLLTFISLALLALSVALWIYIPFRKGLKTIENYEPE